MLATWPRQCNTIRFCLFFRYHLEAIGPEFSPQEDVHEVDVPDDIEEVDGLGDEQLEGPDVVCVQVIHQVLGQHLR